MCNTEIYVIHHGKIIVLANKMETYLDQKKKHKGSQTL